MGINCDIKKSEIKFAFDKLLKETNAKIIKMLLYVGEQCVKVARDLPSPPFTMRGKPHTPNYIDDTANLRNSIGYILLQDGNEITNSFPGSGKGAQDGKNYAKKIAENNVAPFTLIIVAGMSYAKYVAAKGYDVLDSAELTADKLIPQMLQQLTTTDDK